MKQWPAHVTKAGETWNVHRILITEPFRKQSLGTILQGCKVGRTNIPLVCVQRLALIINNADPSDSTKKS
jgi:hypothetical protein